MRAVAALFLAAALVGGAGLASASAETRVPADRTELRLSFAPVVKRVAPAVVNIYTKRVVRQRRSPFFDDPFFRRFFGDQFSFGPPRERVESSLGSGVIVRPDGLVVTNNHVVEGADAITVVLADRREFAAKVVLKDPRSDLAVLRIDASGQRFPILEMHDSDNIEVGDLVLAIGNPFGVGQTVTSGIVSAVARPARGVSDFSFFIQTDAAINPGNSGGALVTLDGRLVGINTAIYTQSGGSAGIGFAIPSNMVVAVVEAALAGGKISRPWLGAGGQAVDSDLAASLGLKRPVGVLVNEIYPGGPADRAGLDVGDVVVAIDGHEVEDAAALRFRIAAMRPGTEASLLVIRGGHRVTLPLPIEKPPETPPRNTAKLGGRQPLAGATVANLSPAVAEEMSLDPMAHGVVVVDVEAPSIAARFGFQPGDAIVAVNGRKLGDVAALKRALSGQPSRWVIDLRREGKMLRVAVGN